MSAEVRVAQSGANMWESLQWGGKSICRSAYTWPL
jgi:hypothetical protein